MATKQAVNKSQAVRDYLNAHPGAGCREIATALDKQGIKITLGYVATIKTVMIRIPPGPHQPLRSLPDPLTLDQIKMVAQAIKRIRLRCIDGEPLTAIQ